MTDLVLATLVLVAAPVAGVRRASRWLYVLAALVAARVAVAGLLATGGLLLADSRLVSQIPLAVLPLAWAMWRPGRIATHVAAAGALLSVWWLLVPFAPGDAAFVVTGSVLALAAVAGLSAMIDRWRGTGSRLATMPWLGVFALMIPAVTLVVTERTNSAAAGAHQHGGGQVSVDQLTGPRDREPDVRFTMTAARGPVTLASGRTVEGLTFNGTAPGPELRVAKGQLVEVTLINTDVAEGVTLHWHGVDVPNAEDGVPGVTQDAVMPGGRHVYRFVATREGSYWYHTHRDGSENVQKGLFGALIVADAPAADRFERTVFTHVWPGDGESAALDRDDRPAHQAVPAGREVLLRLMNSSREPQAVRVSGVPFTVVAHDGNPIEGATPLEPGTALPLAAGGRYDVAFTMPDGAVTAGTGAASLTLDPAGTAAPVAAGGGQTFDRLSYGSGAAPAATTHQRTFDLRLDDGFGFSQGTFGWVSSSINGRLYPAVPTLEVARGDRVKVRIASRSIVDHPFHLHGHRVRVLSRNGAPVTGSPWWTDTLNVGSGELYEVEFAATNPGIWMDHCHNFEHGANGMIMHVAYAGVSTPYSSDHSPE
ncbi:multicopper oxidase family protein [Catenuloplanes indicus]|uniref:FtsP/CotA-like multicopper oxidase with cupredoxin domain n=1 Tax=Catenuloplanes indicus TaxID=137267 RepID=A0AAE3W5U6_9ACTN|nr:multicopper oxidase family protein [Catenuloplanes indicus]MDQ0370031.1 FtsP/CotA-like multicopper oxidase with cupredoxin domain [Catenuloplanes indicus]